MMGDTPYRIAYVIGELGKGGAEYQLHELLRHLDRSVFAPRVFALAPGGTSPSVLTRLRVGASAAEVAARAIVAAVRR